MKSLRTRGLLAIAITAFFGNTYAAELEEIIVTAQKRAESLQDVPISMTALEGEKMQEVGIHSFQEISAYVPNLSVTENAVNTIIGMRGVGAGASAVPWAMPLGTNDASANAKLRRDKYTQHNTNTTKNADHIQDCMRVGKADSINKG